MNSSIKQIRAPKSRYIVPLKGLKSRYIVPLNQVKDVMRVNTATPDPRFPKGVPDLKVFILFVGFGAHFFKEFIHIF